MQTLNLIYPNDSDIRFETSVFPDGQPHIKIDLSSIGKDNDTCQIVTRISSANDLLIALFANDVLRYQGIAHVDLYISYLLTARMDRVMSDGESFSLKTVANLINSSGFRKVGVFDPHSDVSSALINNCHPITYLGFARDVYGDYISKNATDAGNVSLVAPDAGAQKKIYPIAFALGELPVIECAKQRDPATGKLSKFQVYGEGIAGRTCILLDDMLDAGGTFTGIAEVLHQKKAKKIIVAVSHGIFSKGYVLPHVDWIYTTDSYRTFAETPANMTVLPVSSYLPGA